MNQSESIDKIAPALLAAQRSLKPIPKSATNPHFKSAYAPLDAVVGAALEALNANGITLHQGSGDEDAAGFNLLTRLIHRSGQWIEGRVRMPLEKGTAQAAGSALSYGRRYGVTALLGMVAEDDDDGNAATVAQIVHPAKAKPAPKGKAKKPIKDRTEIELLDLRVWAEQQGKDDLIEKINAELDRRRDVDLSEIPPELAEVEGA